MTDDVTALADTVLYEGYLLYPYRRSALKNQRPYPCGTLYPEAFCRAREEGDVPQKCEIDSRYLSVDKPAEDGLPTPPRAGSDDRWSALDNIKDLKDQP